MMLRDVSGAAADRLATTERKHQHWAAFGILMIAVILFTGQVKSESAEKKQETASEAIRNEARSAKAALRVLPITPDLLRKKLRGRAKYDANTHTLTLYYDFKKKVQMDDFKGNPVWVNGSIGIPTGEHALHVAKFTTVTVSGMVAMKSAKNPQIMWTTGGFAFGRTGPNLGISRWDVSAVTPGLIPDSYIDTRDGPPESVRVAPFEIILTHKMVFRTAG